jgi:ubiquitin thioesterase protein OTUB1
MHRHETAHDESDNMSSRDDDRNPTDIAREIVGSVHNDDSIAAQLTEQNASVADDVFESRQYISATNAQIQPMAHQLQQYSSLSEGVASAGHPPGAMDRMGEFVPGEGIGHVGVYEGETSGMHDPVNGSNLVHGTDTNTPTVTHGPGRGEGRVVERKSNEDLIFGEMEGNESTGQMNSGGVHRVSSEMGMVMGLSDGENDMLVVRSYKRGSEPTDSNLGCIMNDIEMNQHQASASFKDRPSDADIIAWENQIRERQASISMLIGDRIPLQSLNEEYDQGSDIFKEKIECLLHVYGSMRRSRGDGNCFFRSFIFAYLENLVITGDTAERDRISAKLSSLQKTLVNTGYEELVIEGPMELLLGLLGSIHDGTNPLTVETLEQNMRSDDVSNYIVFLLRIITSAEVKANADFFAPFVIGLTGNSVEEFCSRSIDPMGEESDHIQLVALTNALEIPIRVVYLDGSTMMVPQEKIESSSTGTVHVDMHDFLPDACSVSPEEISVHLLYRPGHYDILNKM